MKKYRLLKSLGYGTKKGMTFQWDSSEHCYTTKELPWFCTPLLERWEVNKLIKEKYLIAINP